MALQKRCQYFPIKVPSDSTFTEKVLAGGFLLDRFMAAYILASGDVILFMIFLATFFVGCTTKSSPQRESDILLSYFINNISEDVSVLDLDYPKA